MPYILQLGVKLSIANGLAMGSLHFVTFGTWAAALYYGAWRVSHQVLGAYYTGGDVLTVVIAALIGGFAIGQVGQGGGQAMPQDLSIAAAGCLLARWGFGES